MFSIGVDLGRRRDPSAIAVAERKDAEPEIVVVRFLERVQLRTPYSAVARRVAAVARHPALAGSHKKVIVDGTGVGDAVLEMLREARPGCEIRPVVMTGGGAAKRHGDWESVPRVDLLARVQAGLECGWLRIARVMPERERLMREMTLLGSGEHDDLVIAVALAVWGAKRETQYGERNIRLPIY